MARRNFFYALGFLLGRVLHLSSAFYKSLAFILAMYFTHYTVGSSEKPSFVDSALAYPISFFLLQALEAGVMQVFQIFYILRVQYGEGLMCKSHET